MSSSSTDSHKVLVLAHPSQRMEYYTALALRRFIDQTGRECVFVNLPDTILPSVLSESIMSYFPSGRIDTAIAINTSRNHYIGIHDKIGHVLSWMIDGVDWRVDAVDDRDWIIGYVGDFPHAKNIHAMICPVPMSVSYASSGEAPKYGVVFAGNRGDRIMDFIKSDWLRSLLASLKIKHSSIERLALETEAVYERGERINGYCDFERFARINQDLSEQLDLLTKPQLRTFMDIILYWGINERLYRQIVIKWLMELGVDFKVAGCGWEWTGSHSVGFIDGLEPLQSFWKSGRIGLHLNSLENIHHRIWEIAMAWRPCLTRGNASFACDKEFSPETHEKWNLAEIGRLLDHIDGNELKPNMEEVQRPNATGFISKDQFAAILSQCL